MPAFLRQVGTTFEAPPPRHCCIEKQLQARSADGVYVVLCGVLPQDGSDIRVLRKAAPWEESPLQGDLSCLRALLTVPSDAGCIPGREAATARGGVTVNQRESRGLLFPLA